jgi:hypothetical protein
LIEQILEIDENYPRAKSNYNFFKELMDDALKGLKDDPDDKTNGIIANDPFKFKNNRPIAYFDQRDLYEALCREGSKPVVLIKGLY